MLSRDETKRFVENFLPIQKRLKAYIMYHVPNKNDVEDILQNVVVTMMSKFQTYSADKSFFGWAIAIAKFTILSFYRDSHRKHLVFEEAEIDLIESQAVEKTNMLEQEVQWLQQCLKKLPDRQKEYLTLRYKQDLSYRQIARRLSLSMQSVYRTVTRIQISLLKCMRLYSHHEAVHE